MYQDIEKDVAAGALGAAAITAGACALPLGAAAIATSCIIGGAVAHIVSAIARSASGVDYEALKSEDPFELAAPILGWVEPSTEITLDVNTLASVILARCNDSPRLAIAAAKVSARYLNDPTEIRELARMVESAKRGTADNREAAVAQLSKLALEMLD
jgi:hypothetical protein